MATIHPLHGVRRHTLMENRRENAFGNFAIKQDVLASLHAAKAGPNLVIDRRARDCGRRRHAISRSATGGLLFAPRAKGIDAYGERVGFGFAGKAKRGHCSPCRTDLKYFSHTQKRCPDSKIASPSSMAALRPASFASYCRPPRSSVGERQRIAGVFIASRFSLFAAQSDLVRPLD